MNTDFVQFDFKWHQLLPETYYQSSEVVSRSDNSVIFQVIKMCQINSGCQSTSYH